MSSPLLRHLIREHAAIVSFLELLDQEAEAMIHGDFPSLPGLAARKSALTDQIAALGRQREVELVALGHAADRRGADAAAAGSEELQTAWHDLLKSAAQARELNHRNGVMVHMHLDFTRQSIRFLQVGGLPLYGPDGTHKTGGSGNRLALG